MSFYKLRLTGFAQGHDIQNIFYYVEQTTEDAAFNVGVMTELADSFATNKVPRIMALAPDDAEYHTIEVSIVDDDGNTTSPFQVEWTFSYVGTILSGINGVGQCFIVACKVEPLDRLPTRRVTRRSYLAVGPITEEAISSNGGLVIAAATKTDIEDAVAGPVAGATTTFVPCRVGTPDKSGVVGLGKVVSAHVRQFTSFRRSRTASPMGFT